MFVKLCWSQFDISVGHGLMLFMLSRSQFRVGHNSMSPVVQITVQCASSCVGHRSRVVDVLITVNVGEAVLATVDSSQVMLVPIHCQSSCTERCLSQFSAGQAVSRVVKLCWS